MDQHAAVLKGLRTLFGLGSVAGLSDGQLLDRFLNRRGEASELAFTALVERHGPMVLRVCRQVLNESHDVEDAFQATFLVLVKKARSIRRSESAGSWLHGVALRVASRARASAIRRRRHERDGATLASTAVLEEHDDSASVLHQEVARLPEKYRTPVVLCYLEGRTYDEAAAQLRWPVGTVKSRLARARERLQRRLLQRGLAPSLSLATSDLSSRAHATFIRPELLETTVRAATAFAARTDPTTGALSAAAVALTEGVLHTMLLTKWKSVAVASIAAIGIGSAVHAQFSVDTKPSGEVGEPAKRTDVTPAAAQPPQEADRLKGLESKLDRILKALEGSTKPTDARAAYREAARNQERAASAARLAAGPTTHSQPYIAAAPPGLGPDRLSLIEGRLARVEQRLDALEKRLPPTSSDSNNVPGAPPTRSQALYDALVPGQPGTSDLSSDTFPDVVERHRTVVPGRDPFAPERRFQQERAPSRTRPSSSDEQPINEVAPSSDDLRPRGEESTARDNVPSDSKPSDATYVVNDSNGSASP